ncbi:MAG: hypothetical protein P8Y67_13395 [Alphaproteobacteria bacterium]
MRHISNIAAAVFVMLLLCLSQPPAYAQNQAFEAAEEVPVSIHNVSAGGFWTAGKNEGFFRTVVYAAGVEHVSHRLFIQWLRSDAETQNYELIRTVNVKELNLGSGYVLDVKTDFGKINAFVIDVTAKNRGGAIKRFAIIVSGDGKYTIRAR